MRLKTASAIAASLFLLGVVWDLGIWVLGDQYTRLIGQGIAEPSQLRTRHEMIGLLSGLLTFYVPGLLFFSVFYSKIASRERGWS